MKYYITINGGSMKETRELGLGFTGLELQNMQADSATLRWTRRRVSDACPLVHNDTVEIFADTRRIFRGRTRLGSVTSEGAGISILGPWSHLEEMTSHMSIFAGYMNSYIGKRAGDTFPVAYPAGSAIPTTSGGPYTVPPGPDKTITWTMAYAYSYAAGASVGTVNVNLSWSARHWLFRVGGTPGQVYTTLASQFSQIMAGVAHLAEPDPFTTGLTSFGSTVVPKVRTISDTNLAECVRQTLAMKPDAAVWWDYSGISVPVLRAGVASAESSTALGIGDHDGHVLTNYSLKVADELVPAGVLIRWESGASNVTGLGNVVLADAYPAATPGYAPGVLVHTVETEMPYVTGLAQEIHSSLAVRRAQGQLTLMDRDFSLGLRPGKVFTLTGDPQLAGVQLWVQSVSWSADTGMVQLTVGYPAHLQLRDRVDLRGWLRYTFHGPHFTTTQIIPPPP